MEPLCEFQLKFLEVFLMDILENHLSEFQTNFMKKPLVESLEESLEYLCAGILVEILCEMFEGIPILNLMMNY